MGVTGITFDDVDRAVSELTSQGKRPTNLAVHQHLGTGSMSTINKHMKVINARELENNVQPKEVPSEVEGVLQKTMQSVWAQAHIMASQDIEKIRSLARERIERAEAELEEITEAFDLKVDELANLKAEHNLLKDEVERLKNEASIAEGRRQALEQQFNQMLGELGTALAAKNGHSQEEASETVEGISIDSRRGSRVKRTSGKKTPEPGN